MTRVTFANGTTKDYEFADTGTVYADFPAKPTSMAPFIPGIGYHSPGLGERWVAGATTGTSVTGGSITINFRQSLAWVFGDDSSCTITWH